MIAKQLESIVGKNAHRSTTEMVQRFQKLRDSGLLPTSRGKNADNLTMKQIAAGILSIVPTKPGFTIYAESLLDLRPVGGIDASFFGAKNLSDAINIILERKDALDSFQELRASVCEIDVKGTGGCAEIIYKTNGNLINTAYFVQKTALSVLGKGAEETYNPRTSNLQVRQDTVFYSRLFENVSKELSNIRESQVLAEKLRKISEF